MSTGGFVSFVADGRTKTAHNHCDSYPQGLGADVLDWLRTADLSVARERAVALRVAGHGDEPTEADVARLKRWYDPSVDGHSPRPTWFQLLYRTRRDPEAMLEAGVIKDASAFPADSLFAEWGYVVDFDARTFEVYRGFQQDSHHGGRFAGMPRVRPGYAPVRLVASWPLDALPDDGVFRAAAYAP